MNLAVALAVGGVAAYALLSKKSNAATLTPSVVERMTAALATGDPQAIRLTAAALRTEGYFAQAGDLEKAAQRLETQPAASTSSAVPKTLKRGSQGTEVSSWQTFLKSQGYANVEVDGVFGVQTEDATKQFQRSRGLLADGIVGPDTLRASTTVSPAVAVLQPKPAAPPPPTLPPANVTAAAAVNAVLKRGSQGPEVVSWQQFLRSVGYPVVEVDGIFGLQTEDGTKGFQRSRGLLADGIVGPDTKAASLKAPTPPPPPAPVPVPAPAPAAAKPAGTTALPAPTPAAAAPAPAPAAKPVAVPVVPLTSFARTLATGMQGADVAGWQTYLRSQLPFGSITSDAKLGPIDGIFGTLTAQATMEWQKAKRLTQDGKVGPKTLAAALPPVVAAAPAPAKPASSPPVNIAPAKWRVLKKGLSGADVREWQLVLLAEGYALTADGMFGPDTETKTKLWQVSRKLTADGIVGAGSVAALRAKPPATVLVGGEAAFRADSPLPGIVAAAAPPLDDLAPDRSLAARLALHLHQHREQPGTEDRELVETFQRMQGLNPTGVYGPGTAVALIAYGLVPPAPYFWPSHGAKRARDNYRAALHREAMRDRDRRSEWQAAASRI